MVQKDTPLSFIDKVINQIDKPDRWTQGCDARTRQNVPIGAASLYAAKWCLYGAWKVNGTQFPEYFSLRNEFEKFLGTGMIIFNDTRDRTHGQVMIALKEFKRFLLKKKGIEDG